MGMDVNGLNPENEKGEYFRNNCWWWRPLWAYCCNAAPEIIDGELASAGGLNDGAGLKTAKECKQLAHTLRYLNDSKQTKEYEKRYKARMKAMPDVECKFCNATGTRTDLGDKPTKCNACHGKGFERPSETLYPFDTKNVEEFVEFLENCGGFEIC